ncbi:MAG TPA: DUF6599 family protein [archaeon]|nr:DUF6599 family protein [archaeon]
MGIVISSPEVTLAGKWKNLFWLAFIAGFLSGCGKSSAVDRQGALSTAGLLPVEELPGSWKAADSVAIYKGRQLYEYIDGGADIYLEYGFLEVAALEYRSTSGESIFADLYRMTDPEAAFGIFSCHRRPEHKPLDMGSAGSESPYQLIFFKGAYFLELQTADTSSAAHTAMSGIARRVEAALAQAGTSIPEALKLLPQTGLLPNSAVLVRGPLGLSSRRYLSDENLFSLSQSAPGVLGSYRFQGKGPEAVVLVVAYPDSAQAERVFSGLEKFYQGRAGGTLSVSRERLVFTGDEGVDIVDRKGLKIVSVFGAQDKWAEEIPAGTLGD